MIIVDTNVLSASARPQPDPRVVSWINAHDADLALTTITLAEISFGIERTREAGRAKRLTQFFEQARAHFSGRILDFDEEAALIYGKILGAASLRGRPASIPDGMIAAIALQHRAAVATRNARDFEVLGVRAINPWG